MNTAARLIAVLVVAATSACEAASATTPPAVVALARASQDDSFSELAAGLALEAGHWLVNRNDVVVRMVNDPSAYSTASFVEVNDRLAIDLVVWVDVRGTAAELVVSYVLETSTGKARAALPQSSDGLPAIPRRIAEDVLASLKLGTTGTQLPAWPMPASPVYDAYVRALGRAHTKATTEAERHYRLVHFASFLGQSERALQHLETSIRGGFFNAPYIASDPLTTGLRTDPGFAARLGEAQKRHASFKAAHN